MEIERGRPKVTIADHPTTIYRALGHSTSFWKHETTYDPFTWEHTIRNERESLRDCFGFLHPDQEELWRPDGKYMLLMSVDQLEHALVGYGVKLIEANEKTNSEELNRLDDVLRAIDKALKRKKY